LKQEHFFIKLLRWYEENQRDLPWRNTKDPYKIWLSEIILQQTRVAQGLPYYQRFVEAYPRVEDLAAAPQQEVLRLWQGLGYYSRARNLHACAQEIVENFGSKFPQEYQELLKLKGIGKYTAAAIASFAFQKAVPAIDGNAFRVFARIFGLEDDIAEAKSFKKFFELGEVLIPADQPDLFNQAVMEFGATHCTPKKPDCNNCVFQDQCFAFHHHKQAELPVKTKKVKVKKRYFHYLVLRHEDQLLMRQRTAKDIWQGLYDFYLQEEKHFKELDELESDLLSELSKAGSTIFNISEPYKHVLSHQQIFVRFFEFEIKDKKFVKTLIDSNLLEFYKPEQVHDLPKPILVENYLQANYF
jgi:A/G-specific adenine glycosylase